MYSTMDAVRGYFFMFITLASIFMSSRPPTPLVQTFFKFSEIRPETRINFKCVLPKFSTPDMGKVRIFFLLI